MRILTVSNIPETGHGMPAEAMSQVRRSPMEMVCDILKVVSGGPTKPTHILYKANMSWKVLSSYLDYLTSSGMLDKEEVEGGKRSTYVLTIKGKRVLRLYDGLKESLNGTLSLETADELGRMLERATPAGRPTVPAW